MPTFGQPEEECEAMCMWKCVQAYGMYANIRCKQYLEAAQRQHADFCKSISGKAVALYTILLGFVSFLPESDRRAFLAGGRIIYNGCWWDFQASTVQQDQEQLSSNMKKSKVGTLATLASSSSEPVLYCMAIGNSGR
eukprot:1160137-Pelagomonas_calceolata.AAC.15